MEEPKEFELFKKEFTKWQQKFGCTGWAIYFESFESDDDYSNLEWYLSTRVATARFNTNKKYAKDWKNSAKHEAIHLLLARLESCGKARFVHENEIYESAEELVYKLMELIS